MVEVWVLHIVSLRQTFELSLIKILPGVKEIWSGHEIQGSYSWVFIVTLNLSQHGCVMDSAHFLTEANIWAKFNENPSRDKGDMKRTRNSRGQTRDFQLWPWPWVGMVEMDSSHRFIFFFFRIMIRILARMYCWPLQPPLFQIKTVKISWKKQLKTWLSLQLLGVGWWRLRTTLNSSMDWESVTWAGRRFQSWMVLGKKELLYILTVAVGWYSLCWPLVRLSFSRSMSPVSMSTAPCRIL